MGDGTISNKKFSVYYTLYKSDEYQNYKLDLDEINYSDLLKKYNYYK